MARNYYKAKSYSFEERWERLSQALAEYGVHQPRDGEHRYLMRGEERATRFGRASMRLYPRDAELSYVLPLPLPLTYRAELMEAINALNAEHWRYLTIYLCEYRDWAALCMDTMIPYPGCYRTTAHRVASGLYWRMGQAAELCVRQLKEALPEYITDETLQQADEEYYREPSEEDFAGLSEEDFDDPLDYADALLEHYYSDAEPAPSFAMPPEKSSDEPFIPDWPEEWGDEEAFLAENGQRDLSELSGSELIKTHVALARALSRKKQQLAALMDQTNHDNPNHT